MHFERFRWSGLNSESARAKASASLSELLASLAVRFPRSHHYVIAHSHGGNVALRALATSRAAVHAKGLVSLATPFFACTRRNVEDVEGVVEMVAHTTIVVLAIISTLVAIPLEFLLIKAAYSILPAASWVDTLLSLFGIILVLSTIGTCWGLVDPLSAALEERWCKWLVKQQDLAIASFSPGNLDGVRLLSLRLFGDEPGILLRAARSLYEAPFRALQALFSIISLFLVWSCWLVYVSSTYVTVLSVVLLLGMLLSAVLVLVMALQAKLGRTPQGFQGESFFRNFTIDIEVLNVPEGCRPPADYRQYDLRDVIERVGYKRSLLKILRLNLIHSWAYADSDIVDDIARWILRAQDPIPELVERTLL